MTLNSLLITNKGDFEFRCCCYAHKLLLTVVITVKMPKKHKKQITLLVITKEKNTKTRRYDEFIAYMCMHAS